MILCSILPLKENTDNRRKQIRISVNWGKCLFGTSTECYELMNSHQEKLKFRCKLGPWDRTQCLEPGLLWIKPRVGR